MAFMQISHGWLPLVLLFLIPLAAGEGRGRGRRSDDSDPLEIAMSTLSQKVDQMTSRQAAQDALIAQLTSRIGATEQAVAFTAHFSGANEHGYGVGQTMKFNTVVYNTGSGYNLATGLFTAPSDGTYAFFVHLTHSQYPGGDEEGAVEADIMANGSSRLLRVGACCSNMNSGSNLVTVHLAQGDTVHVQIYKGSMFLGVLHTSFSGYRLSPL